ncbi:MAG: hypothetical protein V8Q17_08760 [Acutalibacteraceae bacterium]
MESVLEGMAECYRNEIETKIKTRMDINSKGILWRMLALGYKTERINT